MLFIYFIAFPDASIFLHLYIYLNRPLSENRLISSGGLDTSCCSHDYDGWFVTSGNAKDKNNLNFLTSYCHCTFISLVQPPHWSQKLFNNSTHFVRFLSNSSYQTIPILISAGTILIDSSKVGTSTYPTYHSVFFIAPIIVIVI